MPETTPAKDARSILNTAGPKALHDATQDVEPIEEQAEAAPDPADRFFYDGVRYHLDTAREFVPMDQKSASRHMKGWGHEHSEIEAALCGIQTKKHIHFAGPLAGPPRRHRGTTCRPGRRTRAS